MLSKEARLKHKKGFEPVFAKGIKAYGKGLGLRFGKRYKPEAVTRFGFVVGTKVSKESVTRNLLKRRMREVVRAMKPRVLSGFDVVVIAFPEGRDMDFASVQTQIEYLLSKAQLLKG